MKWNNKRLSLTILYEIQIKGQENHRLANRREEKGYQLVQLIPA